MIGRRRGTLAAVVVVIVALAAALGAVRSGPDPAPPDSSPPAGPSGPPATPRRQVEDELLRERLGALAAVVVDDPALAECRGAAPEAQPAPATGDPVAAVRAWVEQLRGMRLTEPVDVQLLDDDAMTTRVREAFAPRWDDERLDVELRVLSALAAVPPGTDLEKLRVDAFAEQVSGLFSPADGEVAVRVADPDRLAPLERVVLAHELEHALTYAHLGRPRPTGEDARLAAAAVVEGSAVLAMLGYAEHALTDAERTRLRSELLAVAYADPLAGYSPYLRSELRFPYLAGVRFVCELWQRGGWAAVDEAYADPPATTAEVLAGADSDEWAGEMAVPRPPEPPGHPGVDWQRAHGRELGAAQLRWLLAAPGGDPDAAVTTMPPGERAWGGGELVLWTRGQASAVGLALTDRGYGPPLCDTVRAWYAAAFPQARESVLRTSRTAFAASAQHAVLACEADQVRIGIAPSAAEAAAIAR